MSIASKLALASILLFSHQAFCKGQNINLRDGGFYYEANISITEGAYINAPLIQLSIAPTPCNQAAIEALDEELEQKLKRVVLIENKRKALNVRVNGEAYALKRDSRLAKFLKGLPEIFKRLKRREQVLCK